MKRAALAPLAMLVACGGPPRTTPPQARPALLTPTDAGIEAGASAPTARVLSLEELEARGPTDAPLMKALARVEGAGAARPVEIAAKVDQCLRASFSASKPVKASFVDDAGARGEAASGAFGTVPPRGPVCMKRGERVRLVFEADADAIVRAVVFSSP